MSEPSKLGAQVVPRTSVDRRVPFGKTRAQLSAQIDRLFNATQTALESATGSERRRIRERYLRAGDIYTDYYDRMSSSRRMDAAINRYYRQNGSFDGIGEFLDNVMIPRSQYMRRRNNRR